MSDVLSNLTQAELLALALDASRRNDAGHALAYLKEASGRTDVSPQALFMLASEYAQLGMLPEAKATMSKSVEAGSNFPLARFQLGMLHVTSGEIEAAKTAWAPLGALDPQHPQAYLATFRRGMLHLVAEEFNAAVQALEEGISQNQDNLPLSGDMRKIIDAVEHLPGHESSRSAASPAAADAAKQGTEAPTVDAAASAEADVEPGHLFISAYTHGSKPH
ncbi:tetratricopeptide repeat protein [Roseateles sp. NT4]|uniref:tetratricopeptide repeat protein n=1 Tax=Roseateles sp. NT4 TaxID=3453715 RepID=UPI003EEF7F7B